MKYRGNYLGMASRYLRGKSWDVKNIDEENINPGSYLTLVDREQGVVQTVFSILHLHDDALLAIFGYLQLVDVVR